MWANCWEGQCQVWYVFWAILRAPTDSEFWNSSVWRKCLPTEIVEGQVSRPNWGIAWAIVWCSLGARLESQLYLLMCLVDRQKCFDCSHRWWPARFSGLTSRFAEIVRFYLRLFQTEVGCLELCLVYCSLGDHCFLVWWMSLYLTFFDLNALNSSWFEQSVLAPCQLPGLWQLHSVFLEKIFTLVMQVLELEFAVFVFGDNP